jgi:outer membrane protein assembly factor BamE (lipoprotein component of BamABCDE complex)
MTKLFLPILCVLLIGCEAVIDNRGYNNDNIDITQIKIGHTTTNDVQNQLGSATTISNFIHPFEKWTAWLYITKKTATTSFFQPKVLLQKTLTIVFDERGIVRDIKETSSENVKDLEPNTSKTAISSYEESAAKGVFGSFGRRLNSSPKKKS